MYIDYIDKIGPEISCNGKDNCPICKAARDMDNVVTMMDLKTKHLVHLTRSQYDIIQEVVAEIIKVGESQNLFEKNGGFAWVDIPLAKNGKNTTISVKRTVIDGKPQYEWKLSKV